jgi:regulator of sigma E protease
MGPKLFSITSKKTGTVYSIRLLPLGGYVSMLGENGMEAVQGSNGETNILINTEEPEESPEGDDEKTLLEGKEEASAEDEKEPAEPDMRSYSNQSVWRRMFISLAGPFMNVVLGFLLMLVFVVTTAINNPLGTNQVAAFFVEYSAEESYEGLQEGDYIHKVDGTLLQSYAQLERSVAESESKLFSLEVRRAVTEGEEKRVENVILTDVYLDETILKEQFVYSSSERTGLQVNDTVVKVNSTSVHTQNELAYEIMNQGWQDLTLTVIRNGEKVVLAGTPYCRQTESDCVYLKRGIFPLFDALPDALLPAFESLPKLLSRALETFLQSLERALDVLLKLVKVYARTLFVHNSPHKGIGDIEKGQSRCFCIHDKHIGIVGIRVAHVDTPSTSLG